MKKPTIALLYDFDKTLSGKDQQEYTFIPSLKISTLISRVFQLTIMAFVKSNKKILHAIAYFLFVPYYIINLNNIIFTYHYLRDDELYANKIACELGYGEYLRCYYGLAVKNDEDPLFIKLRLALRRL